MMIYAADAALPAPALPPNLPRTGSGEVAVRNAVVSLLHGARFRDGSRGVPVRCIRRPMPTDPALLLTLESGGQQIELIFETMPFADRLHALIAPWTPESLPESLRRVVAEVLWGESGLPLPAGSRVADVCFFPAGIGAEGIHLALEAVPDSGPVFLHLRMPESLDTTRLPASACLDRGAALYPPGLRIALPLVVGRAELDAGELSGLEEGDVIVVREDSSAALAPLMPPPYAIDTRPRG